MSFKLNSAQRFVVDEAINWYYNSPEQVFQFKGKPGRGKTTVLKYILKGLGLDPRRVAAMAYIGCAALVMRTNGLPNARTIHSWISNPTECYKYDEKGNILMNTYFNVPETELDFELKPSLDDIDLMIVDEGWTVPAHLRPGIESYGIKIITCGDPNQLPPVGDGPAYLHSGKIYELTEPMRQAANSPILYLADRALDGLPIHPGYYGDCIVIYDDELTKEMVSRSDIVLCGTNNTREKINKYVREDILHINTDIPAHGEKLICRKNNWKVEVDGISLANGLIGSVVNYPGVHSFDGKIFSIDFQPNMMQNAFFHDLKCDYNYLMATPAQRKYLKNDKYSKGNKFEYAYGITTHCSQGSQFYNGIYMQEFLGKDIQTHLDYTGITRFKHGMIYVKHKRKFY